MLARHQCQEALNYKPTQTQDGLVLQGEGAGGASAGSPTTAKHLQGVYRASALFDVIRVYVQDDRAPFAEYISMTKTEATRQEKDAAPWAL